MEEAIEEVKEESKSFQFYSFQSSINDYLRSFYREDATLDIIEKDSRYKWRLDGYEGSRMKWSTKSIFNLK